MSFLFGGGGGGAAQQQVELNQQQAKAAQLRQLASLSRQQAEVDQARSSSGSRTSGRRLLTFIGANSGASTVG